MTWTDDRNQPQARVLLDSISPEGVRLTTMEVTCHRFVLAEFNTHRVFSRNSASSRAIPFAKQVEKVRNHPAIPVEWRAEQSGMQGGDLLGDLESREAKAYWLQARDRAVSNARVLHERGVHKSIVNRLLEPFMWHNIIVTATEWGGFWHQRVSVLAQPEIRVAAGAMKAAFDASEPVLLGHGEWHTPLIQPDEDDEFWIEQSSRFGVGNVSLRKRVSAARCARVSYLTHDGERSIEKDLELYERLVSADPGHWSPFEHVATPCLGCVSPATDFHGSGGSEVHLGNLREWFQFRHEISAGANA